MVRYGPVIRVVAAREDLTPEAIRARLDAAGHPASVSPATPSVEDLFISFVDRERKTRLREQLRAIAVLDR